MIRCVTMDNDTDTIGRIHKRQIARLLDHLKHSGQYTAKLEKDLKRSFGFVFRDVEEAISQQGNDKELQHGIDATN